MASNMWLKTFLICLYLAPYFFYGVNAKANVIELDEDNWERMMTNEWMVEFYAPWCPACKALQPVWEEFSSWSEDLDIEVGQVDVTESPGLSGRFMVTALPTIFHVLNGEFRQYRGAREKEAFISFVEDKKWKSIDAIPSWKSPGSLQMSVVSYFFKLSQLLRTIHNILMEEYGLPTWGPYIIFALATIFIGALLGLILVCIIDFIYPPKPLVLSTSESAKGTAKTGDDKFSGDEMDDGDGSMFVQDDLVDEIAAESDESESEPKEESGSPSVRKRKLRKAD